MNTEEDFQKEPFADALGKKMKQAVFISKLNRATNQPKHTAKRERERERDRNLLQISRTSRRCGIALLPMAFGPDADS